MLKEIIIDRIKREGFISFHDFMDMCLYYPGEGYYVSPGSKIGTDGDFYTSPVFTRLFGELIAKQIEEMWEILGRPSFTIVEYGAGPGHLCYDIMRSLQKNEALYQHLEYCIIEKGSYAKKTGEKKLEEKISRHATINEIGNFTGCVLSNEVVDNFPVHLVTMKKELMEVVVGYNENGFVEALRPAGHALNSYLRNMGISLPFDYRTEINLDAGRWLKDIADAMQKGYVLTIDYGYPASDFYHHTRYKGTLMCFQSHEASECPYINIGKQDITAHVDFSGLKYWGQQSELEFAGFTDQLTFLKGLGIVPKLRQIEEQATGSPQNKNEINRLIQTFLFDMGNRFKVLLLQKEAPSLKLSGMQFSYPEL